MLPLDSSTTIRALDTRDMAGSIALFAKQIQHAWSDARAISIPDTYKHAERLVVFGMGGSALGTDILQHLWASELHIPVSIINDYVVPGYVNESTLVLLSSYSGSTEEVLAAAKEVMKRTKLILVMAAGKQLAAFAKQHDLPLYTIVPTYNPCDQPRIALGYSLVGQVALLSSAGVLPLTDASIHNVMTIAEQAANAYGTKQPTNQNTAKQIATWAQDGIPVLVSSQHLVGVTHAIQNQINENGKHLALMRPIPEMNHHALEGMGFPSKATSFLRVILCESKLYDPRNQKRYAVLKTVLQKQGIAYRTIHLSNEVAQLKTTSETPATDVASHPHETNVLNTHDGSNTTKEQEAFTGLSFGAFTAYYIGLLNGIDPSPIPWLSLEQNQ